jgi:hypothetical protein
MGAPQIIYLVLMALGLLGAAYRAGKSPDGATDFFNAVVGQIITVGLLTWGGFFR